VQLQTNNAICWVDEKEASKQFPAYLWDSPIEEFPQFFAQAKGKQMSVVDFLKCVLRADLQKSRSTEEAALRLRILAAKMLN
jgi:hypothetical protein